MAELFSSLTSQPFWLIAIMAVFLYLAIVGCIRTFLRPVMVSYLDPLNIKMLVFIGPAIIGFVLVPLWTNSFSQSYFLILLFLGVWLVTIRTAGKPNKIDLSDKMDVTFQVILLSLAVLIVVSNVVVNMIIPGKIPLLTEGGMSSRFDATDNSRLLTWLSFSTAPVAGLMYAVTQDTRVRRFAIIAVVLRVVEDLLFASKAGILTIVFILLNSLFIAKARGDKSRYKMIRRALIWSVVVVALFAPLYLSTIGAGSGSTAVAGLGVRFLGGFDQLIFASQFDLLRHDGFHSLIKSNIAEYQLMPFFKVFLSTKYDYSSVGQYVIEAVTGTYIEGPYTFPNSNLILETVFTSGKYFGFALFVVELVCFYRCRITALSRPITPFSLVLVLNTVLDPTGLFSSGQEWATETVLILLVVIGALVLSRLCGSALGMLRLLSTPPRVERL